MFFCKDIAVYFNQISLSEPSLIIVLPLIDVHLQPLKFARGRRERPLPKRGREALNWNRLIIMMMVTIIRMVDYHDDDHQNVKQVDYHDDGDHLHYHQNVKYFKRIK